MAKKLHNIRRIFLKTDGCCHLCHRKLSFSNHGLKGSKGGWHIEHSVPKAKGGSDYFNNLYPACIVCNIEKGTLHTNTIRRRNGVKRAPFSRLKKQEIGQTYTIAGSFLGGLIGSIAGPRGFLLGAFVGGIIGNQNTPVR